MLQSNQGFRAKIDKYTCYIFLHFLIVGYSGATSTNFSLYRSDYEVFAIYL